MTPRPQRLVPSDFGGRRLRAVGLFGTGVWLLGGAIGFALDAGPARTFAVNLVFAVLLGTLALGSWRRIRLGIDEPIPWYLLGACGLLGMLNGLLFAVAPVFGSGAQDVLDSITYLTTIAYPVLVVAALLAVSVARASSPGPVVGGVLEGINFAGASFLLLWLLGFREVAGGFDSLLSAMATVASFVGAAAALGVVAFLREHESLRGPLGFIAAWALLALLSEALFAYLAAAGLWYSAHPTEIVGLVRLVPLAMVPWAAPSPPDPGRDRSGLVQDVIVYLPVMVALIVTVLQGAAGTLVYDAVAVSLFLLVGLAILLRQLTVLRTVRKLSRTLGRRVEERTSELTETRRQLAQTQRLDAIGRLAGGVAHDFNNLLTAIGGHAELILESLSDDDPNRPDAEAIRQAASRGTTLTRKLLTFARRETPERRPVPVNGTVEETVRFLARVLPAGVEMDLRLAPEDPMVQGDPGQIDQLVTNLVINARDAVGSRGKIAVSVDVLDVDDGVASVHGARPGRFTRISVVDDGVGIDEVLFDQLFEPFFTTKTSDEGTGLGLATCYGIASGMGGFMTVESTVGEGSTFRCWMPVGE